ncbi:E3 binding domain-containing protein [Deinococcus budaensis]|uniref:Peripheral subunit-binding (PSBD) domain-containing protein n=1 Tax=Deinococcus budaensis TaxID=1665626 RepID=A0A7W8GDT4_9DEIO|nr:E3 binding domain-containing protein [Deinococcus budaensis]MBB5233755.1 hypothetical protein [Deinococcus budaensis]
MERIAPLAKILAEANGIDWQHLHGSGEGGLIVEQDILNYLTRIMSGEEEPPATPVDAPPPEWTGTELPPGGGLLAPGMPSMDMLSSAGVDSDLAALVGQPASPVAAPAASLPDTLLDDALEFELEDEPEPVLAAAPEVVAPIPALPTDLEVAEPVAAQAIPAAGTDRAAGFALPSHFAPVPRFSEPEENPVQAAPAPTPAPAPEAPAPAAAAATGGVMGGLGNLLSRLYQAPAQPSAPEPLQPAADPAPASHLELPPVELPASGPPRSEVAAFAAPEVDDRPAAQTGPEPQPEAEPLSAALPEAAQPEPMQPEPTQPEPTQPELAELVAAPVISAPLPQTAPPQNAVWFGSYLRRDADLRPAAELRRQLTGALGQDVPLALLVARAARHHAGALGLASVAVQDTLAGRARAVEAAGLRDALAALGTDHDGTPDLLVTDAGALDLDELHLPHTLTLSVGRVQEGRAALTLNGDVDPAQGARFLAGVAATLEEPIILVL